MVCYPSVGVQTKKKPCVKTAQGAALVWACCFRYLARQLNLTQVEINRLIRCHNSAQRFIILTEWVSQLWKVITVANIWSFGGRLNSNEQKCAVQSYPPGMCACMYLAGHSSIMPNDVALQQKLSQTKIFLPDDPVFFGKLHRRAGLIQINEVTAVFHAGLESIWMRL